MSTSGQWAVKSARSKVKPVVAVAGGGPVFVGGTGVEVGSGVADTVGSTVGGSAVAVELAVGGTDGLGEGG